MRLSRHLDEAWAWFTAQGAPDSRAFDAAFGVETARFTWTGTYEPSSPQLVDDILAAACTGPLSDTTFVDIGAGKGRACIIAAQRPFREVVGIEIRRDLVRTAERNLARARMPRPLEAPIRFECADARHWEPPPGPVLLYLFNPLSAHTLEALAQRACRPGIRLAYAHGVHSGVLDRLGWRIAECGTTGPTSWAIHDPPAT